MDKFSAFASQAKAKASEGRAQLQSRYELHSAQSQSQSGGSHATPSPPPPSSPSLRSSYAPPSSTATGRGRTASSSSQGGVFVGIDAAEKRAFYGLLDEYFQSRPQYAELFQAGQGGGSAPPPVASAAAPTPTARTRPQPPAAPVAKGIETVRAAYDYTGAEAEDLSFAEGDEITVLEKVSDDWWKGESGGRTGLFPAAYVETIA